MDYKKILKEVKRAGWSVTPGKRHLEIRNPEGRRVATCASTPSDRRAVLNFRADLRRAGLAI
jgi:hypothetical protein